ncbi:MAG TPA: hypothetical protein VF595_17005 [Tepidisphaeraceae bacterium]|jgi:hypothetical protein
MILLASLPRIEEHRVPVVFDCPKCCATSVRGTAYNLRETIRVTERMPTWGWSSHWVRCAHCQAELHADCEPEEFKGASATTVNNNISTYLPFPSRFMAIAGLLFGWAPVLGVIVATASVAANLGTRGWPRWLSVIALVLTTTYNVALFGVLAYWSFQTAQPLTPY